MLRVWKGWEGAVYGGVKSLCREVVRDKDRNTGWMKDVDFEHL